MNLRRAMAVAAATAVITPAAFFSAPAAFADGDGTDPGSVRTGPPPLGDSGGSDDGQPAGPGAPEGTPSSPGTDDSANENPGGELSTGTTPPGDNPADSTPPGDAPAEGTLPGDDPADGTTPGDDPAGPGDGPAGPGEEPTKPGDEPTKPGEEPTEDPADPTEPGDQCPTMQDGVDLDSALSLRISGLPGKIVAGSGWHPLTLRATNTSGQPLSTVQWFLFVDNSSLSSHEKDWLSTYSTVQVKDAKGNWVSTDRDWAAGGALGETDLAAKSYVDIEMRLEIGAKAPVGDGFALGVAGYQGTEEEDCYHNAYADWYFDVLAPGSDDEDPGEATPSKDHKPPVVDHKPQGGATVIPEIPLTGSLAATGSSSLTPVLGVVGGIAIVAGAGVVFAMKRRRSHTAV